MGRSRNPIPRYRHHRRSGKAILDIYNAAGKKTSIMLPGAFGSPESKAEYERVLAVLRANEGRLPPKPGAKLPGDILISELVVRFLEEKVTVDYVHADGTPTNEVTCYRQALKPIARLFGNVVAREFDAASLGIVRQSMINGSWMNDEERAFAEKRNKPLGWSRGYICAGLNRIRSMFRWAVTAKLVPAQLITDLQCLQPLRPGKSAAREIEPVIPVTIEAVDATLPHMPPTTGDMVRVQLLIGCRPGELCAMHCGDIDRSGPVWLFVPRSHKTQHHGHKRTIAVGPQAQLILRRYLKDDADAFVFSPAEQDVLIKAAKRAKRKTPVQPSQRDRSKPNPIRKPKAHFDTTSYNRAIARACEKAGVAPWHAHQLRHTAALLISREHGSEAARAVLGHKTLNMTLHYAGVDLEKATDVARKMG